VLILGIDTATSIGSVALFETESRIPVGELSVSLFAAHSEKLIPYIDFLLEESSRDYRDIDIVAVSIGPGSFTGLRVGLSTAKGLAFSLGKKPIVAVDSLMARAFSPSKLTDRAAAFIDAKRDEVFAGIFEMEPESGIPSSIMEPRIVTFDKFVEECFSHNAFSITVDVVSNDYIDRLSKSGFRLSTSYNALSLCELSYNIYTKIGASDINTLSPKYLRDFKPGTPR